MKKPSGKKRLSIKAGAMAALLVLFGGAVLVRAQADFEITHEAAPEPPPAEAVESGDEVVTDSSKEKIEIGLTYRGEIIEFFGTTENTGADAVVVVLRSPVEKVKLNQKGRVGPFWMAVKQHEVENIPFIYKVHASRPIGEIMSEDKARELRIGFESIRSSLKIHTIKGKFEASDEDLIFNGLVALKKKDNLYKIDDQNRVSIKGQKLFKHNFTFPSAAKEGEYFVDSFLFKDGILAGQSTDKIMVRKIGLEAKIVHWADAWPKTYGVVCVVIALGAGLLVGNIFKGGAH